MKIFLAALMIGCLLLTGCSPVNSVEPFDHAQADKLLRESMHLPSWLKSTPPSSKKIAPTYKR